MSKETFSVQVSSAALSTDLEPFLRRVDRIKDGIINLLEPIVRGNEILLVKRIQPTGEEWLDVHIKEGRQRSLVPELEQSLGHTLTDLDIESSSALIRVREALTLLSILHTKHRWAATELMDLVERQGLARSGRQMSDDKGTLTVVSPDGQSSSAVLPKRGFSALRSDPVDVQFRPLLAGPKMALVQLSKSSKSALSGRSSQIKLYFGNASEDDLADRLFKASKSCAWMRASCRVIENRDSVAKALLMESLPEQTT